MSRLVVLSLSALAWLGFLAVTVWTVAFLADVAVPHDVSLPIRLGVGPAVAVDLTLLGAFALQHSVMARVSAKAWLRRWVPAPLERTAYVLATDVCLVLLLVLWQPFGGQVWRVHGVAALVLWTLFAGGWGLAIAAMFAVDFFELTGLRQAGWLRPSASSAARLHVGGLHGIVRHPLMTGLLVAFWATPHLSLPHLLFAAAATAYILLGVRFEERDLRRTFGAAYDDYARRVPALLPSPAPRSRRGRPSGDRLGVGAGGPQPGGDRLE